MSRKATSQPGASARPLVIALGVVAIVALFVREHGRSVERFRPECQVRSITRSHTRFN